MMRIFLDDPIDIPRANGRDLPEGTKVTVELTLEVSRLCYARGPWVIPSGLDAEALRAVSVVMGMPTSARARVTEVRVVDPDPASWWQWWDDAMRQVP